MQTSDNDPSQIWNCRLPHLPRPLSSALSPVNVTGPSSAPDDEDNKGDDDRGVCLTYAYDVYFQL